MFVLRILLICVSAGVGAVAGEHAQSAHLAARTTAKASGQSACRRAEHPRSSREYRAFSRVRYQA